MSRRGAESPAAPSESAGIELVEVEALGHAVVELANRMLAQGLDEGEACTLLLSAAVELSQRERGLARAQLLAVVEELLDRGELEDDERVTSPGGQA